ncbi:MAG: hypothetical protein LBU39_08040 [Desulfobulbaceae bacterium]|nr:hypothetical protein [Desulfobulbaceae bacterium]
MKIALKFFGFFLLLAVLAPQFAPFSFIFATPHLDTSWVWATNEAVAQKLVFGKEFIFTSGPYTGILNRIYHPATYNLNLFGGLFCAAACALAMFRLRCESGFMSLLCLPLLVCFAFSMGGDSNFYCLTLLIGLATMRAATRPLTVSSGALIAFLWAAQGVPPLMKGSLFIDVWRQAPLFVSAGWR